MGNSARNGTIAQSAAGTTISLAHRHRPPAGMYVDLQLLVSLRLPPSRRPGMARAVAPQWFTSCT